jgi:hypothetical protein
MPQSEQTQAKCRSAKASAVAQPGGDHFNFCAFELPHHCPNVSGPVSVFQAINDPMKSVVLSGWLHGELHGPR